MTTTYNADTDTIINPPPVHPSKRFVKAMRELRKIGFHARTGVSYCCRSCIVSDSENHLGYTDEQAENEQPLVWTYAGQGSATNDINLGESLLINHSFLSYTNTGGEPANFLALQAAFADQGLVAEWPDSSGAACVEVYDVQAVTDKASREASMIDERERRAELRRERQIEAEKARQRMEERRAAKLAVVTEWANEHISDPTVFDDVQLEALWAAGTSK